MHSPTACATPPQSLGGIVVGYAIIALLVLLMYFT